MAKFPLRIIVNLVIRKYGLIALVGLILFICLGAMSLKGIFESLGLYGVILDILLVPPLSFIYLFTLYHFYCYGFLIKDDRSYSKSKYALEEVPVSIIVPIYNEPMRVIKSSLNSLSSLHYGDLEVIVADGSSKNYSNKVEMLCAENGYSYTHRDDAGGYNGPAILQAANEAHGNVIGIVDSDYIVNPEWLNKTMHLISDDEISSVQCPQCYRNLENSVARVASAFRLSNIKVKLARALEGAVTCTGTMVLHEKGLFQKLFPADFATSDFAYSLRLISRGKQIMYVPKVMGSGIGPTSVLDYARQQARWLDNLRGLLFFSKDFNTTLSLRKRMHLWVHGISHLNHLAAGIILFLGISTLTLDFATGIYLLALYFGYSLYRLLYGKFNGAILKIIDVFTLMKMDAVCTPILFRELMTIIIRKASRYERTPKNRISN